MPVPDEFSDAYWRGANDGELVLPRCANGHLSYPPGPTCPHCGSAALTPTAVDGNGTIYSFTVVRQSADPAFAGELPYVVAMVELDAQPGLRLLTNVVGCDPADLEVGTPVEVCFESRRAQAVTQFRPVATTPAGAS